MESIGVREARQNLSVYLDRVKAGESLTITEHGRPVAVLRPVKSGSASDDDAYAAMIEAGLITPAKRPFVARPIPARRPGERSVSEVWDDLREDRI
jgi:prevent-host-death family protein